MIVKKEIEYAKEIGDVGTLLAALVRDIRAKKGLDEIAKGNLQNLVEAVDKIDQVDDEIKQNRKIALATVGYHTGEITDAILS